MRINEVEQMVDISKKNIRFYEEQGLLHPQRNENNRYREYSEEDIEVLKKIKLLRKLAVPISEIRKMREDNLSLEECLHRHLLTLEQDTLNLSKMQELCRSMIKGQETFQTINAQEYLLKMENLEKGGVVFVDSKNTDKKMKKKGVWFSVAVAGIFFTAMEGFLCWATWGLGKDSMPLPIFIFFTGIILLSVGGIVLAVKERMKEIEGGEYYEASKY